jgi:PTS system fructose-specific IIC component
MKFVAITACPTGIAHTYMAAEALEEEARKRGHEIHVETQGSAGGADVLDASDIAVADAVIIAADTSVSGRDRFAGLPLVETRRPPRRGHGGRRSRRRRSGHDRRGNRRAG